MPLKLFDFLCDAASRRQPPALHPSCHGETRSSCPFRSIAEARTLNLVAGSAVQWPVFATGYEHVWRLVAKNCNPFVNGAGHGGAYDMKTGQFSIPSDFADHNAKAVEFPNRSRQ